MHAMPAIASTTHLVLAHFWHIVSFCHLPNTSTLFLVTHMLTQGGGGGAVLRNVKSWGFA